MFRINDKHLSKLTALFLAVMLALPVMAWAATGNSKAQPGMSSPEYSYYLLENVEIPMRDGVITRANIWIPEGDGPWPTVTIATPYSYLSNSEAIDFFGKHGYAVLIRDVRGIFASDGEHQVPYVLEQNDQYDCFDWIVAQEWSNGKIAAFGGSQLGQTTLNAIASGHPNLVCAIPVITSENLWRDGWYYRNGAFELAFLTNWSAERFARPLAERLLEGAELENVLDTLALYAADPAAYVDVLPVVDYEPSFIKEGLNFFEFWASHPTLDDFWQLQNPATYISSTSIPVMYIAGWYDIFANGPVQAYINAKNSAYTKFARDNQYLVVGPWGHAGYQGTENIAPKELMYPLLSYTENDLTLAFLDYWMKDLQHPSWDPDMHVVYSTKMSETTNRWNWVADWPLPNAVETPYYLNAGKSGTVNSLNDGTLSTSPSPAGTAPLTYAYDPMNPISTRGGNTHRIIAYGPDGLGSGGPQEQTPTDQRSLTFTSAPLTSDLEVTGKVIAVLYASTDAVDTDWVVRLNDVAPDGTSTNVVDGILRARYRDSPSNPTLLEPGQVYEFEVDLWSTSWVFREGHSLRVTVNSSNFPKWSRNMNVAEFPEHTTEWVVANNTIYLDPEYPSHIILPVVAQ